MSHIPLRYLLPLMLLVGCPADDDPTDSETDGVVECDPVGDNPIMNGLLNEPVQADVEVITKTPQHPGDPGPDNLP